MIPVDEVTDVAGRPCAVCERGGAVPCEDCARPVCELHARGFRWVERHRSDVVPNLCASCETARLLDDERRARVSEHEVAVDVGAPRGAAPLVQLLWWARLVVPVVVADERGVTVESTVQGVGVDLAVVRVEVVDLLARLGLAALDDRGLAPRFHELVDRAGMPADMEVPVARRFFAGYTSVRGHALAPLPGRLDGAPRVHGALLTPGSVLWGQYALIDEALVPVGGFEERAGNGALDLAVVAAVARLVPEESST